MEDVPRETGAPSRQNIGHIVNRAHWGVARTLRVTRIEAGTAQVAVTQTCAINEFGDLGEIAGRDVTVAVAQLREQLSRVECRPLQGDLIIVPKA